MIAEIPMNTPAMKRRALASMRPRSYDRGNEEESELLQHATPCFNEAAIL